MHAFSCAPRPPVSPSLSSPASSLSHAVAALSQTSAKGKDGTCSVKSRIPSLNWKLGAWVERAPKAAAVPSVTSPPWHIPVPVAEEQGAGALGVGGQEGTGIKSERCRTRCMSRDETCPCAAVSLHRRGSGSPSPGSRRGGRSVPSPARNHVEGVCRVCFPSLLPASAI